MPQPVARAHAKSKSRSALIEEGLRAVESGLLTVEDLVRRAGRDPQFRTWLARRLAMARTPAIHRPRLRRCPPLPPTVARRAVALARDRLRRRKDVVSVHWGTRRVGGRLAGTAGVVVLVRQKLPLEQLPPARRIPDHVLVIHNGARFRVGVDVQARLAGAAHTGEFNVGNRTGLRVEDRPGTLGGLITLSTGVHGITAGHVAGAKKLAATAVLDGEAHPAGSVESVVMNSSLDLARVGPLPADTARLAAGPRARFRDPHIGDVNTRVQVLRLAEPGGAVTFVSDVGISASLLYPDGKHHDLTGLTAVSPGVTQGGDSGAAVIDYEGTVLGFVVGGGSDRTYILPAQKGIDAL